MIKEKFDDSKELNNEKLLKFKLENVNEKNVNPIKIQQTKESLRLFNDKNKAQFF